ncbi:MAG: glycosyl hydrolase [Deltaproteobacteria bacterium]|nr:MAG: glycosyl hydrolase [Deltaproteobacteria bacterium]
MDVDPGQVEQLVANLTLDEKAQLCSGKGFWFLHGVERLGLPSIMVTDGPHGLRKQTGDSDHVGLNDSVEATCFPTASGLAATWNRSLLRELGEALGRESRAEHVSVLLGPGINIKRHPLGGRNFEYFSEDPYLSGAMATEWIHGVQSQKVGASLKHYAVNNHEHYRMVVDAIVDERTLREIYLTGFEMAIKESQPWTVMCAYNKLNGTYLAEHHRLLTSILEEEWGFQGLVVTDWGANNNRVDGLKAGQALEMPSSGAIGKQFILKAIREGDLTLEQLDRSVAKVVKLILQGQDAHTNQDTVDLGAHHRLARDIAAESCVLLQNEGNILPLSTQQSIAVLGALAVHTRYQGAGSSQITPHQLETPLEELQRAFGEDKVVYSEGYSRQGALTQAQIDDALKVAEAADNVVLVVGLTPDFESEGFDRHHMDLPSQQLQLIDALAPVHHKLVVVLQNGAPVALPFKEKVPAILEAYLGGQAGASALVQVLTGEVNPSGKLAETFPLQQTDVASDAWFPGTTRQTQYRETIWVGYRYFDTAEVPVAFPFGHGLSYTTFAYNNLTVSGAPVGDEPTLFSMKESDAITVEWDVTNTGSLAGSEAVQLYIGQVNPKLPRPKKELRAFDKVFLKPGDTQKASFVLKPRDFAYWSVEQQGWVVDSDAFVLSAAASVADVRLEETIRLQTEAEANTPSDSSLKKPDPAAFSEAAFEQWLGRPIPEPVPVRPFHTNTTLMEIQQTWLGRKLVNIIKKKAMEEMAGTLTEENSRMLETMLLEMPLRNLVTMSEGKMSLRTLYRIIHVLNGNYGKAVSGVPAPSK